MRDFEVCRPYVECFKAEHRVLRAKLIQLRVIIDEGLRRPSVSATHIVEHLQELREALRAHFEQEEAGGYIDEAVCQCPRLSSDGRQIEAEHPAILAEVSRLIANAGSRVAVKQDFDRLIRRLRDHEERERRLLERAFGTNLNGYGQRFTTEDTEDTEEARRC